MSHLRRLTFYSLLIFTAALALVTTRAHVNPARAFFGTDNCEMPCWQGIQLGVTPLEDAVAILDAHPWVNRPRISSPLVPPTYIPWLWSDAFPYPAALGNDSRAVQVPEGILGVGSSARLQVVRPVVTGVSLGTGLHLADVWLALGPPTAFSIGRVPSLNETIMSVRLIGMGAPGVAVTAYQRCPLSRETLWASQPLLIQMTAPALLSGSPPPDYVPSLLELLDRYDRLYCG
ncbi:MAG: hypothetical protein KJ065_03355 [Anaerolineae bacterium]|nr:hypothetical protein [Anaerolineae bacterium]